MAAPSHIPRLTLMRTPFVKMSLANPRSSTWLLGSERSKRRGPCPGAGYFRALLLDSRVFHDQQLNERRKQRFASLSGVVHKLVTPHSLYKKPQSLISEGPELWASIAKSIAITID